MPGGSSKQAQEIQKSIERARAWLRNTGVGSETMNLIESAEGPVRRIFRQMAELGVPCSMAEDLIGHKLEDWANATSRHMVKLQTLWALAEAYTDVANRVTAAIEGLDVVVIEAQRLGVYYNPPACAAVVIEKKAKGLRLVFTEEEEFCRPGRSINQHALWLSIVNKVDGVIEAKKLTEQEKRIVELRIQARTAEEIAAVLKKSSSWVKQKLLNKQIKEAILAVKSYAEIQLELRRRSDKPKPVKPKPVKLRTAPKPGASAGRPKKQIIRDEDIIKALDAGSSYSQIAKALRTTRQFIWARVKALKAKGNPPTPLKVTDEPAGLPPRNLKDGAPKKRTK